MKILKQKPNDDLSFKTSFINIEDNLAPTDNGKVYGFGMIKSIDNSNQIKIKHI